jgi:hypothetical protein
LKAGIGPWPLRRGEGNSSGYLLLGFYPLPASLPYLLASIAFTGLCATDGVAILSHRPYDIDVVVKPPSTTDRLR